MLEAESGLNDAPTVVLVTLASSKSWSTTGWYDVLGLVTYELAVGLAFFLLLFCITDDFDSTLERVRLLLALGVLVLVSPGAVPGLTVPSAHPMLMGG